MKETVESMNTIISQNVLWNVHDTLLLGTKASLYFH